MAALIHPLILCGGSGTRLWPLSRKSFPKQFGKVTGEKSLFQAACLRLCGERFSAPMVITGNDFRFVVTEQLAASEVQPATILIEPEGRNTAPAILASALVLAEKAPQGLMLVSPSDHVIPDAEAFRAAVVTAAPRAMSGDLVTFGITPTRAETGYGWLEVAEECTAFDGPHALTRFVEKPQRALAKDMLASGRHLWNAGIFLFRADVLIAAFEAHAPEVLAPVRAAVTGAQPDLGFLRLDATAWASVPDISIDYAIMERVGNIATMPFSAGWSDLGGWDAVWLEAGPDASGNVTSAHATAIACEGTLLRSESDRVELVGIGLRDIIAVATTDAVLVAHKSESQKVKDAVAALKSKGRTQATQFPSDHRPWGMFESLVIGPRFQVKRIVVKPGAVLSLQSHHHRSEHWIVVEGTAKVTIEGKTRLVTENQSVYVPLGAVHRMENPGKVPMVLIEVQTGSYLGEDDIIRYEDVYARGQGAKG